MARAVDRLAELLRRQELRNRSLKLKLCESACFVLIDFRLRESWMANNVRKQLERLVEVLDEAARADHTRQRRQTRVSSEGRSKSINLLRNVFAGALRCSFAQQRRGEARNSAIVSLV